MRSREQSDFKKPWVGCVEAKAGNAKVRFTSIETFADGKVKKFDGEKDSITVNISDLPKRAQRVIKPNMDTKKFRIRLNQDGDAVEEVGPISGTFRAKFIELGPKKKDSKDAVPFEKFYKKGQPDESSHLEFFAVYEITEGVFKGVRLPAFFLHYKFEGIPEGEEGEGLTRLDTPPSAKATQRQRLTDWAEVQGDILEEDIVWEADDELVFTCRELPIANILPVLEERALDADRDVEVVMEKGYIKLVQAVENYETEDDDVVTSDEDVDEVDEAFPPTDSVEEVEKPVPAAAKKAVATKAKSGTKKPPKHSDDDDDL